MATPGGHQVSLLFLLCLPPAFNPIYHAIVCVPVFVVAGTVVTYHQAFGESYVVTGCRELEEETGLRVNPEKIRFMFMTDDSYAKESKHYITIHVTCEWDGRVEPTVQELGTCCEGYGWVVFFSLLFTL